MKLPILNLPPFKPVLFKKFDKVYIQDILRNKPLLLTPEEWVRQHFLNFLKEEGYPMSLLAIEVGFRKKGNAKRTDIVAYAEGKPFLLVECKGAHVALSEDTLLQASNYNRELKAPYIALTNGLEHIFIRMNAANASFERLENLPSHPSTITGR